MYRLLRVNTVAFVLMLAALAGIVLYFVAGVETTPLVRRMVLVALSVSLAGCILYNTARRVMRILRPPHAVASSAKGSVSLVLRTTFGVSEANSRLNAHFLSRGWKASGHDGDGGLERTTGSAGVWGSILFHLGLALILAGVTGSALFSFRGMFALTEGEKARTDQPMFRNIEQGPGYSMQDRPVTEYALMEFNRDYRIGTASAVSSVLRVMTDGRKNIGRVHVNASMDAGHTTLHQGDLWGYSVALRISTDKGTPLLSRFVRIATVIKGDSVSFADRIHLDDGSLLSLTLYPDHAYLNGQHGSRSIDLRNPVLKADIRSDGGEITTSILGPGEEQVCGKYVIAFPAIRYWSQFTLVEDPGMALIFSGAWMAVAGLCARLLFTRTRRTITVSSVRGTTLVTLRGDRERFSDALSDILEPVFFQIEALFPGHDAETEQARGVDAGKAQASSC